METISIPVDAETAQAYQSANSQQQAAIQNILKLFFNSDFVQKSLSQVMEELATKAEQRGLTPEMVELILSDDAS
ncbi:hypothetical protein [[Limnothrix rosea] IAM M-220]|uniref:hypothetical protein n=1 Tax=[Limnothrix rosea] IAM M-220 TaxID=454133 RepID=UPI000961A5A2|nr:hypothetical protein [[Limnothrix rosea] IAM M-220]OKH18430.1 hypothetical protein NIES208_05560 [[Limnothrix rosea] IAM M-220]